MGKLKATRPVIIGEVLFDRFPNNVLVLGGAPFNVAWHLHGFGASPLFVSRIGDDEAGKKYLNIHRSGDNTREVELIDNLTHEYVEFSGHTFPHILVPLLAEQNVMINPARPMVFYESMVIDLDRLDIKTPVLVQEKNEVAIDGKRGEVQFAFNLVDSGTVVGRGKKRMVLGGLREYDATVMNDTITSLNQRKQDYLSR